MRNRVALLFAALPACSLFSSLDDLSENVVYVEAGADGPAADGTSGSDTGANVSDTGGGTDGNMTITDAGDDSGYPNIHPNGTFDVGCQGWFPYNATLAADSTAHSGAGSCRVCANATVTGDVATIDEGGVAVAVATGGVYVASAWFRIPDGASGPPSGVKITLVTRTQGGADLDEQPGSLSALDANWQQLKVQLTATQDAAKIRVWAGGGAVTGTCFLIDDLRVERWQ